jgi:peptidyl-tRNA hydrolase, PTH1 family
MIAGLGNPGPQYAHTRHNLGFEVMDALARRLATGFDREKYDSQIAEARHGKEKVLLLKPLTFMNRSGTAIAKAARNGVDSPEHLLVVVDDINLPLGRLRFRDGGSAGGHNGLKSIIAHVGTDAFHRLRMGVGEREPGRVLTDHVLGKFRPEERPVAEAMIAKAVDGIVAWLDTGIKPAMNQYNGDVTTDGG